MERVPPNYTIIYHLATLDDDALRIAEQQGLIRPDLRRSELLTFKRSRGTTNPAAERALKAHLNKLIRQRLKLDEEIAQARARLEGSHGMVVDGEVEKF